VLKIATLIATLVAASAFASHAEAHGMGSFYASPFFRNQGRQPAQPHCAKDRRRLEEAFARAQERRLAELRAQRAAEAAAAATKRARLAALKKQQAAARAAVLKQAAASSQTANTSVAKRGDMLPVAATTRPTKTAENEQADTAPKTVSVASPATCRTYSPAADGLIEIPCK